MLFVVFIFKIGGREFEIFGWIISWWWIEDGAENGCPMLCSKNPKILGDFKIKTVFGGVLDNVSVMQYVPGKEICA